MEETWIITGGDWKHGPIYSRAGVPVEVETCRSVIDAVWKRYNYMSPRKFSLKYRERLRQKCIESVCLWLNTGTDGLPYKSVYALARECVNMRLNTFGGYLARAGMLLDSTKEQLVDMLKNG